MFERVTWSYPDKEAIVAWEGAYADPALPRVTYRQADELANRVANALLARGLQRGDRVVHVLRELGRGLPRRRSAIAKAGLTCVADQPDARARRRSPT